MQLFPNDFRLEAERAPLICQFPTGSAALSARFTWASSGRTEIGGDEPHDRLEERIAREMIVVDGFRRVGRLLERQRDRPMVRARGAEVFRAGEHRVPSE